MKLEPGHTIGPYEIVGPLGAGAMGEVYRARDTRLGRDVAIKILPRRIAGDADALARFEREARAVAALSHPGILAIHDFGTHDGTAYAVMELLEGQTLREALDDGPLPPRRALELARQIAHGLGSAHDGGVVHRDLKPDNLFVTRDGRVKILDFGLARVAGEAPSGAPQDDRTRTSLTEPGTVMGTVNYMSPELATARAAGSASDVFSLGVVLYEMLTGRRPFERETAPETMTAILREDPPEITRPGVSPAAVRIVLRCLEKEPAQRFQSAHDLAFAIENVSQSASGDAVPPATAGPPPRARRAMLPPMLLMLAVGMVIGALGVSWLRPASAPPPVKIRPITFSGFDVDPAASPDGRTVAFASRRGDVEGIWVKQLTGGGDVALTDGPDGLPRFSPDGSALLFTRVEAGRLSIYRVPLVGGQPRKLIDDANEADWSPDGSRIVFVRGGAGVDLELGIANADGSGERIVAGDGAGQIWRSPRWSPDGRTIAIATRTSANNVPKSIRLFDVESETLRTLPPARPALSGLAWTTSGTELMFAWSDDLLSGQASTTARMVLQDVRSGKTRDLFWAPGMLNVQQGTQLDIVGPGSVVFGELALAQNLIKVESGADGSATSRTLTAGNSVDRQPCLAPDGETILFASNRTGSLDLWTLDPRTGAERQLTDDEARDWDPAFTADGREILWSSDRSGNLEIWMASADGSGARQVTRDGVDAENPTATPDGEWIVYMTSNPDHPGLWKIRRDGSDAVQLWQGSGFVPELSPDGRYAAFATSGQEFNVLLVVDIETGTEVPFRILVPQADDGSRGGLGRPRWFDDGRVLAFTGADGSRVGVFVQDFMPENPDTSATRRRLAGFDAEWDTESFDVSSDGRVVILSRNRPGGTIMLAENVPFVEGRGGD